jgi:hypothetical protein
VQPTLIIQELQTIKLKQHNINYINQVRFIKLLRDDCHKHVVLISKSRDDSNRCTPYKEKPNQHITCFPRSVHVWPSTIRISRGPRIATFRIVINRLIQIHCPEKKGSQHNLQHNGCLIRGSVPSFSPTTSNKAVGKNQVYVDNRLLGLLGPYTSMQSVRSILTHGDQPIGH